MRGMTTVMAAALTLALAGLPVHAVAQDTQAAVKTSAAVVNLNTATASELEALPGIGPKTAVRILEYRQKSGNFKKIEELMNVKGIGEKSFLKLKNLITVTPGRVGTDGSARP